MPTMLEQLKLLPTPCGAKKRRLPNSRVKADEDGLGDLRTASLGFLTRNFRQVSGGGIVDGVAACRGEMLAEMVCVEANW